MKDITIVGAGNGGCAMAADLTLRGFQVRLCEIYNPNRIQELKKHGGIELTGAAGKGLLCPKLMTTSIDEAIKDVDIIFCTIPANGLEFNIRKFVPYLRSGQIIILTPGGVGGALFITNLLNHEKIENLFVGETCTLPYGCRLASPFHVEVYNVSKDVVFAMLPDIKTDEVLKLIKLFLPNLIKGETVLETDLTYVNYLLHPVGMILNAGWIEHRKGDFAFYYDGISPSVAKILEELDNERLNIIRALKFKPISFVEWSFRRGKSQLRDSVYNSIHSGISNRTIKAPKSLEHRYILEDVPYGLVPISYLGQLLNIQMPVTNALILIASRMCGKDFMKEGWNLEKMGISKMSLTQIKKWVYEGSLL